LSAAREVGNRLEKLAIWGEDDCCWIGLSPVRNSLKPLPLGIDMYYGLIGISLFLAYLGSITDDEKYTDLARAAVRSALRQIDELLPSYTRIGSFIGWGGVAYSLFHQGNLWKDDELLEKTSEILHILPKRISQNTESDFLNGAAGCIMSLYSIYKVSPSQELLDMMTQCGDWIVKNSQRQEKGVAWIPSIPASAPLTGFSHGNAGIALALVKLWFVTGEARYLEVAKEAMIFEQSVFSIEKQNWPDFREINMKSTNIVGNNLDSNKVKFMTAWCHGATGIGLARILTLPYIDNITLRSEINSALQTTLRNGIGENHCLCHGSMGNIELLLTAGKALNSSGYEEKAYLLATQTLKNIKENGWICGLSLGVETPGLMTGIAGIGYEFLRLAEPVHLPSLLALDTLIKTAN
jgi:type 2 lantibiotic biosynthesis protein LanM